MEKNKELETVAPTENRRMKSSLNMLQITNEGLAEIGLAQKLTLTAMIDEACADYIAKKNNTSQIDTMVKETNGFWFERDLDRVKALLPIDSVKRLLPYQIACLCFSLKDQKDRERTFGALNLSEELQIIDGMNRELEKASIIQNGELKGYNLHLLSHELKAKLLPLESAYLKLKIGKDAFAKLQERRPDLCPKPTITNESDKKVLDEATMNPALETVLAVTALSKATWKALPKD